MDDPRRWVYLTGWSTPETLEAGAMSGAMLETWAVTELLKGYWHNGLAAPFYYCRDKGKKEIDLLIVQNGVVATSCAPGGRMRIFFENETSKELDQKRETRGR
jgi:predicted AAA+ superfamily ATPase